MNHPDTYQIVIVDNPYALWNNSDIPPLFTKIVSLKFEGYRGKYPDGAIPMDTTDFVGKHLILCKKNPQGLEPIMGFRNISLARCRAHFLNFPLLSIAVNSGATQGAEAVKKVIQRCDKEGIALVYNGGWTIAPQIRKDPELRESLKEMMMAFDFLMHDEEAPRYEVLGAGVVHLKTDAFFNRYGYEPLTLDGEALPDVNSHYLGGVPVRFIHVKRYNDVARGYAAKYLKLWNERKVYRLNINEETLVETTPKAA